MNWLHFSDFHVGLKPGPQQPALETLIDFVSEVCTAENEKIDAIFLVGDLTYGGTAKEYANFETIFLNPLRRIEQIQGAKIFAVPGNHDVDCDIGFPITWESIKERNQQLFFLEGDDGIKVRSSRAPAFDAYREFVVRNDINSPDPNKEVSKFYECDDFPFDILATTTAFFSDKSDKSSEPITPSPLTSLRSTFLRSSRNRPCIVLGHHSISSFLQHQQDPFENYLLEKRLIYLHGHEHKPKATFNPNGTIKALGLGAAYTTPLEKPTNNPYRNSFTFCKYTGQLELSGYCWDFDNGRWINSTSTQFASCILNPVLNVGKILLDMPGEQNSPPKPLSGSLKDIERRVPHPTSLYTLSGFGERIWKKLIEASEHVSKIANDNSTTLDSKETKEGKAEFILEQGKKRDLLVCIPAPTHILSEKEVESFNTRLDTEGYDSLTVISFGKFSPEAKTMYIRLRQRKKLEVLVNQDLINAAERILTLKQREVIRVLDTADYSTSLLMAEESIYLITLNNKTNDKCMSIIDEDGMLLKPFSNVVTTLRASIPDLATVRYTGEDTTQENHSIADFEEETYLKACYSECNKIKYSALSNIGLRLDDYTLDDIYISANATEIETGEASRLDQIVDDYLAAYPTSSEIKEHFKKQFISSVEGDSRIETSLAREFCQKYGAVLLTGDPGSGKTCFVKSEILSYSRRAVNAPSIEVPVTDAANWYSNHIPLLVPLAQAIAEKTFEDDGLLSTASVILQKRGLSFPASWVSKLFKEGRLALFFDGLDEVVSVERRAAVVQRINSLVEEGAQLGNRFVVTSRPAAIHLVNLLPDLHQLSLRGLVETEIKLLATRILTFRLSETNEGVILEDKAFSAKDNAIVTRILQDCREKAGVARLAQNPLLLTLLVLIYANAGAPSAKRHLIYNEAIRTLAAVRGREANVPPISVQDLRERLGAVALSVYRKESGFLPTRREVCAIIAAVMSRQRGKEVSAFEANQFLQRVAELTGLIIIATNTGGPDDEAQVTFMHHSFLEYFAAVGLAKEIDELDFQGLITQPRWREILTLLAGIVGESKDVGPILVRILASDSEQHNPDARVLMFALDCALECEVPSEAALLALGDAVERCALTGPARLDPWVRSEIGSRLHQLCAVCGDSIYDALFDRMIRSVDPIGASASISIASFVYNEHVQSPAVEAAINDACTRTEEAVATAICSAAAESKPLRSNPVLQHIGRSLKKGKRLRQAAFEAISRIPSIASQHWSDIVNGIEDESPTTRRYASIAAIQAGLNVNIIAIGDVRRQILIRAFENVDRAGFLSEFRPARLSQDVVDELYLSGDKNDRILGIRLAPFSNLKDVIVRDRLLEVLSADSSRTELSAALKAFRWSGDARLLCRIGDLRVFASFLSSPHSDVRAACSDLLGCFNGDVVPVRALLSVPLSELQGADYRSRVLALGRSGVLRDTVKERLEEELRRLTSADIKRNDSNNQQLRSLLKALREFGDLAGSGIASRMKALVDNYKTSAAVRGEALLTYASIAMPSLAYVNYITGIIEDYRAKQDSIIVQIPALVAENCKRDVTFVLACIDGLAKLRTAVMELHKRFSKREATRNIEYFIAELREGIELLSQILIAFEELLK